MQSKGISYRKKQVNRSNVSTANILKIPSLLLDPPDHIDQLIDLYDSRVRDLLNEYVPLRISEMTRTPLIPRQSKYI